MTENTNIEPGKGMYIFAWILSGILSKITHTVIDNLAAEMLVKSADDLDFYIIVTSVLFLLTGLGITIFIYKKFSYLKISKVMPYIYVLGTIGVILNIGQMSPFFDELNHDPTIFFLCSAGQFILYCYFFRRYFINSNQW